MRQDSVLSKPTKPSWIARHSNLRIFGTRDRPCWIESSSWSLLGSLSGAMPKNTATDDEIGQQACHGKISFGIGRQSSDVRSPPPSLITPRSRGAKKAHTFSRTPHQRQTLWITHTMSRRHHFWRTLPPSKRKSQAEQNACRKTWTESELTLSRCWTCMPRQMVSCLRHVALLCDEALHTVTHLLAFMETLGNLPQQIRHVLGVLIPKATSGLRPIGVFSSLYRLWACCRTEIPQICVASTPAPVFCCQ